ncbi:MAG: SRPBCC domain-containing protein, partial [Gammaproteobacteria bacterium]|nr:SRPBCC domain-containing protein [Gammaproteobacteria bacterium]
GNQQAPFADVPKTLVSFVLEDANGGTRLTVTESGLAALPNAAQVLSENSSGWDSELAELKAFVEAA